MKNMICKILGHSWRYNFPKTSYPSKRICSRCKKKEFFFTSCVGDFNQFWRTYKSIHTEFNLNRTDEEIIKKWFK